MEKFTVGQVVLVTFPFSNFKAEKLRPALILANAEFDNVILCQIISRSYSSKTAIKVEDANFLNGKLPVASYVRLDKLLTADTVIIKEIVGELNVKTRNSILKRIRQIFNPN